MAIEIECDDCGNTYRVSDDKAGANVKCRECGAKITVPDGDGDLFDTQISKKSNTKRRRKSSSGPPMGVIIGLGALAAVIVFGVVLFVVFRRGAGQPQVAQGEVPPVSNPDTKVIKDGQRTITMTRTTGATPTTEPQPAALPSSPSAGQAGGLPNSGVPSNQPATPLPNSLPNSGPAVADNSAPPSLPGNAPAAPLPGKKFGGFTGGDEAGDAAANPALPDAPLPTNWAVKVDPSTVETKIDAKSLSLKFPAGAGHTDVVFPATPSNFVGLGANSPFCPLREIWNLSTKSKIGTVNATIRGWPLSALSPDGQHLAMSQSNGKEEVVSVWICKTGKSLGDLQAGAHVTNLMFASATRLIGISQDGSTKIWKLPSGDLEHELNVEKGVEPQMAAVSPGGNYLAVFIDKTSLKMFDLNTGAVAGDLPLPFGNVFFANKPEAMSFSPDGVELAMVMPTGVHDKEFLIYNVADGKLTTKVAINVKDIWGAGPDRVTGNRLEWFPDRSKLLWRGHHIMDAKLGGPMWSAPTEDASSDAPRKLVGGDRILVVTGGRQSPSLVIAPVPLSEIEAAAKLVAAGGEASDAGLPPLMKADTSAATPIAVGGAVTWTMKPDGAPAGQKVKTPIAIPKERPNLGGIYVSRPQSGRAVIWYSDGANNLTSAKPMIRLGGPPPRGGPGSVDIDVFDVASGKVQASVPLARPCAVLDVGPDGDCVIVRTTKPNDERVDVHELPSGKPIAGWRPHMDQHSAFRGVKHAVLLDSEYCITQAASDPLNTHGPAYLWKLPECKAIWRLEAGDNFTLSPGGKYLGFVNASRYLFMEVRTGQLVAEWPLPMAKARCAFHPMGTHLALLNSDGVTNQVTIIDVTTGKSTAQFYVPHGSEWVQWCGDTNLLLDDQWLIDLKQQKYAWQYELKFGAHALTQSDGRHWFASSTGIGDLNASLSGATLPEPAVAAKIDGTALPDESLLKPGMQFGLQVTANSPMHPSLPQDVGNHFKEGLERNGFSVAQNSPYVFVITTAQSSPNEPAMKFGNGGPFDPRVEVPIMNVTCEVSLLFNGQPVWKNTRVMTNKSFMVFLPKGEEIGSYLTKQVWNGAAEHLKQFPVPKQVFGFTATAGLGQSVFVPGGAQPVNR